MTRLLKARLLFVSIAAFFVAQTFALTLVPQSESITAIIANEDRCFHVVSRAEQDRVMFSFQVRQGSNDFDVRVDGPDGNTIYYSENGNHDHEDSMYFVTKTPGEHSLCIDNRGFGKTEKVVRLTAALMSFRSSRRKIDPLLHSMSKAEAKLISLVEDQAYLRTREYEHRTTLESNNTRLVVRWLVEVSVLLAMSVGQVWYLRRLFQKRSQRAA
jgi:hypothetical protein